MSVHFHSNRCTDTSPAAPWPLARQVSGRVGRPVGGGVVGGGEGSSPPHPEITPETRRQKQKGDKVNLTLPPCRPTVLRPTVLVPRILGQVRVGDDLVRGQRVQVQMCPGCDACSGKIGRAHV